MLQVSRHTDPGARPKKKPKPRDEVASFVALPTSSDGKDKVLLNVSLHAFRVFISLPPPPKDRSRGDERQPVRSMAWLYGFKSPEGTNMDRPSAVRWPINEKTFSTWAFYGCMMRCRMMKFKTPTNKQGFKSSIF